MGSAAVPQLYLDDLAIGMRVVGGERELTQADFEAFAALTGDAHPIHYDAEYAARTPFGRCVAHGLLLASIAALGASPLSAQLHESMIAFLSEDMRFLKPVFVGDRVIPEHELISVHPSSEKPQGRARFAVRLRGPDHGILAEGHHEYLLRTRAGGLT